MNDATVAARSSAIDGIALGSGARGRFDGDPAGDIPTAPIDRDGCSDVREGDSGGVTEIAAWLDMSRGEASAHTHIYTIHMSVERDLR